MRIISLFIILMASLNSYGQRAVAITEDKVIRDGFHIAPLVPTTKGLTFGVGYSRPISPKLLFHTTLCYMPTSSLDGQTINARGGAITPAILYLPGRTDNYKGIIMGVELPIMFYNMRRHDWVTQTSIGPEGTVVYNKYNYINANALQGGLGARFGFRTQRRNNAFFWQPSVSFGILAQKLFNYEEVEPVFDNFGLQPISEFASQKNGIAPYAKLEVAFGLYRFKKERQQVLEL